MKEFECNGVWWPAQEPSDRVAGTLRFSIEKGLSLDLIGAFGRTSVPIGEKRFRAIQGQPYNLKGVSAVTLFDCWQSSFSVGMPGFEREAYHANAAFLGAHVADIGEPRFSSCSLRLNGLDNWTFKTTGISASFPDAPDKPLLVTYSSPTPIEVTLPGVRLKLRWFVGLTREGRQAILRESAGFDLEAEKPLTEDEWSVYDATLRNFLTFATDSPNALMRKALCRHVNGRVECVEVIGAPIYWPRNGDEIPFHRMLFTFDDIQESFGAMLNRWLHISERLGDCLSTYFSSLYAPSAFADLRMNSILQSLNLYHRLNQGTEVAAPQDLLELVHPESQVRLHQWLREHPVDESRTVLSELIEEHAEVMSPLCPAGACRFVELVVAIRNHILYATKQPFEESVYGIALNFFTEALGILMKECLMADLGLPVTQRLDLFQRNLNYRHLSGLATQILA